MNTELEQLLEAMVRLADDKGFGSIEGADYLACQELQRSGYLINCDFDLSGNVYFRLSYLGMKHIFDKGPNDMLDRDFETAIASYSKFESLGEGGVGHVYRVKDAAGDEYALKVIDVEAAKRTEKVKRFMRELRFCEHSNDPAIIRVLDHGFVISEGTKLPFYVMPVMDGNLKQLIDGKLGVRKSDAELLELIVALMDDLSEFYKAGHFHRDIKPQNIMYDAANDKLVLADFGAAHLAEDFPGLTLRTEVSSRLANFDYAAPEQHGKGAVDARVDVYAFGLIINQLFTGKLAHGASYATIGDSNPEFAYLDSIVDKMLQQDPGSRYQSIADCVIDIKVQAEKANGERAAALAAKNALESEGYSVTIEDVEWAGGDLVFQLNNEPDRMWIGCFNSLPDESFSTTGFYYGPRYFAVQGKTIVVQGVGTRKSWISKACKEMPRFVQEANDLASDSLFRLKQEEACEIERINAEIDRQNEIDRRMNDFVRSLGDQG